MQRLITNTDQQHTMKNEEQVRTAYVAGMVDSSSTIHAPISENDKYRLGYEMRTEIKMVRKYPFALQEVKNFCDENGIYCSLVEDDGRYRFRIKRPKDVRLFLKKIYPFLNDRKEEAKLLGYDIVPKVANGEHLEKKSFMELIELIEELRKLNPSNTRSKYTTDYFQNEWDL